MVIRIIDITGNSAPIEFTVPVNAAVEIHLYPGDIPTIEPHVGKGVYPNEVRSFDVNVAQNGDLLCDHVNVTQIANGEI